MILHFALLKHCTSFPHLERLTCTEKNVNSQGNIINYSWTYVFFVPENQDLLGLNTAEQEIVCLHYKLLLQDYTVYVQKCGLCIFKCFVYSQ